MQCVGHVRAERSGVHVLLQVSRHRRCGLGKSCERVPDRASHAHPRPLAIVEDHAITTTSADGATQLCDEVLAISAAEFGTSEVVCRLGISDVVVDVDQTTPVGLLRCLVEHHDSDIASIGTGRALLEANQLERMELPSRIGEQSCYVLSTL